MKLKNFIFILTLLSALTQELWAQNWTEVSTKDALNSAIADGAHIRLTAAYISTTDIKS